MVSCDETGSVEVPALKLLDGLSLLQLGDRRTLLDELNRVKRQVDHDCFE